MEAIPITSKYLRQRAAYYRKRMIRTAKPADVARCREFSELLDREADSMDRESASAERRVSHQSNGGAAGPAEIAGLS